MLDPAVTQGRGRARALRPLAREPARKTNNEVVQRGRRGDARGALRPQGGHDHARGRRRRRQPQPHPARGDRRQGDHPHRAAHPGRHAGGRRALPDRGGAHGGRRRLRRRAVARARRTATRSPTAPSGSRAASAARWPSTASARPTRIHGRVYGGPKWTVSPVYEGMLKEEMDAAAERHPEVPYAPVLIDATYAGLISGAADAPLVIPALNRDGDCLSDLVHAAVRLDRGRRVGAAGVRRRLRAARRDGRGARTARRRRCRARTSPTRWR